MPSRGGPQGSIDESAARSDRSSTRCQFAKDELLQLAACLLLAHQVFCRVCNKIDRLFLPPCTLPTYLPRQICTRRQRKASLSLSLSLSLRPHTPTHTHRDTRPTPFTIAVCRLPFFLQHSLLDKPLASLPLPLSQSDQSALPEAVFHPQARIWPSWTDRTLLATDLFFLLTLDHTPCVGPTDLPKADHHDRVHPILLSSSAGSRTISRRLCYPLPGLHAALTVLSLLSLSRPRLSAWTRILA